MILVGDDYKIEADQYQYILHSRHKPNAEKEKAEFVWTKTYHETIEQCCRAISNKELRSKIQGDLVSEFTAAVNKLCEAIKELK